jgi:hypothetical protein
MSAKACLALGAQAGDLRGQQRRVGGHHADDRAGVALALAVVGVVGRQDLADRVFDDPAGTGLLDGAVSVLRAHVAADGVVEPRVVALADDGDAWPWGCLARSSPASTA